MKGGDLQKRDIFLLTQIFNPRSKAILIFGLSTSGAAVIVERDVNIFYKNNETELRKEVNNQIGKSPTVFVFGKLKEVKFAESVFVFNFFDKSRHSNKYLFSNHTNGEIQFLMPATSKRPYFIHFMSDGSKRTKVVRSFNRILFNFGLKQLVCNGSFSTMGRLPFWFDEKEHFSFQMGKGDLDLIILATGNELYPDHYMKVPLNREGGVTINREAEILNYLKTGEFEYLDVPEVIEHRQRLVITNICPATQFTTNELTMPHLRAIKELYDFTFAEKRMSSLKVWDEIIDDLLLLEKKISKTKGPIKSKFKGGAKVLWRIKEEFSNNERIPTTLAHGDFTKDNMFVGKDKIHVIDWKNAEQLPLYFDLFHFIFMTDLVTDKSAFHIIYDKIEQIFWDNNFLKNFEDYEFDWKRAFRFYLLKTIPRYLNNIESFGELDSKNKLKVERLMDALHSVKSKQLSIETWK